MSVIAKFNKILYSNEYLHYRHIMVANTPGKLNIICATTHAKKPMFTRIYVITHPPRNGHTDKHKAYGNNSILNSVKAVKCNKPNKSAFIQINLTKYLEFRDEYFQHVATRKTI